MEGKRNANFDTPFMIQSCAESMKKMMGAQRSYQRWLDKIIYKMEMKFWAV
jgi:hypothetical protein